MCVFLGKSQWRPRSYHSYPNIQQMRHDPAVIWKMITPQCESGKCPWHGRCAQLHRSKYPQNPRFSISTATNMFNYETHPSTFVVVWARFGHHNCLKMRYIWYQAILSPLVHNMTIPPTGFHLQDAQDAKAWEEHLLVDLVWPRERVPWNQWEEAMNVTGYLEDHPTLVSG